MIRSCSNTCISQLSCFVCCLCSADEMFANANMSSSMSSKPCPGNKSGKNKSLHKMCNTHKKSAPKSVQHPSKSLRKKKCATSMVLKDTPLSSTSMVLKEKNPSEFTTLPTGSQGYPSEFRKYGSQSLRKTVCNIHKTLCTKMCNTSNWFSRIPL